MRGLSLATLLLLLALALYQPAYAWDEEATELAYRMQWDQGVVVVLNHATQEYGTGWFIHPQYVVTAAHVVRFPSNTQIEVVKGDYRSYAMVVAFDEIYDVAILMLERPYPKAHVFPLRENPEKGSTIYVIGFPYELAILQGWDWQRISMNPRAAQGTASWYDPYRALIEIGTYTDAGNSGGPIVDEQGNAIGLITFALEGQAATMYFATSAAIVIKLCKQYGIPYQLAATARPPDYVIADSSEIPESVRYMLLGAGAIAVAAIVASMAIARRR